MSELLNEQLSALLDGELPPEQTQLVMTRLERDPERRARLARYAAVGAVLRGERNATRFDFAERVSAAIAAEPTRGPPAIRRAASWLRPLAGLGVAAAVAGLALTLLPRHTALEPQAPPPLASLRTPLRAATVAAAAPARARSYGAAVEPPSYVTPNATTPGLAVIPSAELARYVVAHSAVSMPLTGRSVLTSLIAERPAAEGPAGVADAR